MKIISFYYLFFHFHLRFKNLVLLKVTVLMRINHSSIITSWKSIPNTKSKLIKESSYYPQVKRGHVFQQILLHSQYFIDYREWKQVFNKKAIALNLFPYKMEPQGVNQYSLLIDMVYLREHKDYLSFILILLTMEVIRNSSISC